MALKNLAPWFAVALLSLLSSPAAFSAERPCGFDFSTLKFKGDPVAQTKCLLRPVAPFARLGPALDTLPAPLVDNVGKPVAFNKMQLRAYLSKQGLEDAGLGGSLDSPLSRTGGRTVARYFVIHDTSTPNFLDKEIPGNINEPGWSGNKLENYDLSRTHAYVNRLGASITGADFSVARRATKFERDPRLKGLFVHTELIQPRKSAPGGGRGNDAVGPAPGFTAQQYDRLALLYIAASARKGEWLIPAFHAVLDAGIPDGHDDPQNFSLTEWAAALSRITTAINNP